MVYPYLHYPDTGRISKVDPPIRDTRFYLVLSRNPVTGSTSLVSGEVATRQEGKFQKLRVQGLGFRSIRV